MQALPILSVYLTATFVTATILGILFLVGHYGFILFCKVFGLLDNYMHKNIANK
jgi:hypothetical protein